MRECWVIEEQNDNGEWYAIHISGGRGAAEEELARWPSTPENPKRLVRYVPAQALAALHQELDWMLGGVGGTDALTVSASIVMRWRNTLAQVVKEEA